jgi:hypothetical protein
MTRSKFVFTYTETHEFESSVKVIMEVPERSIGEMCEYFQQFLTAAGYILDEGDYICLMKEEKEEEAKPLFKVEGDTLIVPQSYNSSRANDTMLNVNTTSNPYRASGVRGGMADDIIKL